MAQRLLFLLATFMLEMQFVNASPILNVREIIQSLNFAPIFNSPLSGRNVKVAILDNGFKGYVTEIGKSLPQNTFYHEGAIKADENEEEVHGLVMAQLLSAILTNNFTSQKISFDLHLFPTFGYSNFSAAVNAVANEKFDVVLYSQIWEYGGNFDGRGFINALVDKAVKSGVLWINAAGNFGQNTFNSPISIGDENWIRLPGPGQAVSVQCQKTSIGKCPLRVVLSWNDFKDNVDIGTEKDLDLILTDATLKIISSSMLVQKLNTKDEKGQEDPNASKYPREILQTLLPAGTYFLRVKARSSNFRSGDQLRIMASGEGVQLVERDLQESLSAPADHSEVVTVGASDIGTTSRSTRFHKPDIYAPSQITISEKEKYSGTSQAAAIVAAAAVIFKFLYTDVDRKQFVQLITRPDVPGALPVGTGLSLSLLQFAPTGPECFVPVGVPFSWAGPLLQRGAQFVLTTAGIKMFTVEDPLLFIFGVQRLQPNDMIVANPMGFQIAPRLAQWQLPRDSFEVLQTPYGEKVCGLTKHAPKTFLMPRVP